MAFSLDRSLSYVRLDEPNLISIHRSAQNAIPSDDAFCGHFCEAFILEARENNTPRVYVAIYDTQLKTNLIFVPDRVTGRNIEGGALVREAEAFLKVLGFNPEPVNIRFSPAVREVIIRDLKVMRPPKETASKPVSESSMPTRQKDESPLPGAPPVKVQVPKPEGSQDSVSNLNLGIGATATKPPVPVEEEATRNSSPELDALKSELVLSRLELEAERAARLAAEDKLALADEKSAADLFALKADRDVLKSEFAALREKTRMQYLAHANAMTELEGENRVLREELVLLRGNRDDVAAALSEEVSSLRGALLKADRELKAERSQNEELSNQAQTTSREVEALRAALNTADESLYVERSKNDSALREMDALEENAAAELESLDQKVESLHAEKRLLESIAAEMKLKATGEIERLQKLNQSQRKAAIRKISELKEEIRLLAEARAVMSSPFAVPFKRDEEPIASEGGGKLEISMLPLDAASAGANVSPNPFFEGGGGDEVSFEPDMALVGVPYAEARDVMAVHRSFNKIHAAPTGRTVQTCEGFVCLVNDGGEEAVFAVWLMNQTDEVLVCRPNIARNSGDSTRRLLQEGIDYFERVGFLMDSLQLEDALDLRQQQLDSLAIFKKVALVCAA